MATGEFNIPAIQRTTVNSAYGSVSSFGLDEEDIIRHYDITGETLPQIFCGT